MCGRTALSTSPRDLREAFGLSEEPVLVARYNVTPSQPIAVVRVGGDRRASPGRRIELLRWGLVPPWAEDAKIGHRLALARSETIMTTPAFRAAIRYRRCLVVVDGFFEWKRNGRLPTVPFYFERGDRGPFALAGIWERWVSNDGEVVESCAILTRSAKPPVDAVHDRMPLVLDRNAWGRWLDPSLTHSDALAPLLRRDAHDLVGHAVGVHVNDPRHDGPQCVAPIAPHFEQLDLISRS